MALSEQEISKTYKLSLHQGNILQFELTGSVDSVEDNVLQAKMIQADVKKFIDQLGTVNALIDLTPTGQNANYPTPAAKKIYQEILENDKIEKIAFVIKNLLISSILRFIIGSKKMNVQKIFKSKAEALDWLKDSNLQSQNVHAEPE